jgi:hypothetical protein
MTGHQAGQRANRPTGLEGKVVGLGVVVAGVALLTMYWSRAEQRLALRAPTMPVIEHAAAIERQAPDLIVAAIEPMRAGRRFGEREPRFDSPGDAAEFRLSRLIDESGEVPAGALMRARAQIDAMRAAEPFRPNAGGISNSAWTWLGPGNIGGRIRAVAIHPITTSTIFAGSVGGGIWKTTNSGTSWSAVNDFMANLAVSSIVFTPGDPNTMYAGTGESGFFNFDALRGAGIFKSTDGGTTWTQLSSTTSSNFYSVNRLAISADGTVLLAATSTGIWRSADGGTSWTDATGDTTNMMDVKFISGSSVNAVAGDRVRRAYYSTNGGATWTTASGPTLVSSRRVEIGVSVSSPSTVYLSIDTGGDTGQIWKSTDSGQSYTQLATPDHLGGQGWYDNVVWVDPTDANRVVVGGTTLSRSIDGGTTWSTRSYGVGIHPDHHAIVHDPGYNGTTNKRVYVGNDGGMYVTTDILAGTDFSSVSFSALNNNLGITQFYGAAGNTTSGKIYGGTQDNGTLLYTPSAGTTWTMRVGGDGGYGAADPNDVNYLYGEYQRGALHRNTTGGTSASEEIAGWTTSGGCKSAPYVITDVCTSSPTTNFISPFVLDPNNASRLLFGGRQLWRSNDVKTANTSTTGPSWAAIKSASGTNNISAIAVAPGNSDVIWVGHNLGAVFKTTNGTATTPTWSQQGSGTLPGRTVGSIAVDPATNNTVYVSFTGFSSTSNLWKTTDGGTNWATAGGSGATALPLAPIYSVVVHPTIAGRVYAGTEVGLFASTDGGATWSLPHDGPANVSIDELFWMGLQLVAVTHGRGVFISANTNPTVPGAPTGVTGTRGNGQVSVSFTAPSDNGGSAITGYTATASPGGASASGSSSPIVVTGLTNGTAYTFTVTATNSIGTSAASSASAAVTPATVPGAPTGVNGAAGNGQVAVSFTAPSSNGGSAITGYTVTASPGGATGSGTSSPITVTGLTNGTAYTFTVVATNSVGNSAASSASSAVTPSAAPGAPTGVAASAGNAQAMVSFTPPSSTGGSAITGYTVTASPGGATGTGSVSPIVVTSLTNGTAYTFTVTATNSAGTGSASSASSAVTPSTSFGQQFPATLTGGQQSTPVSTSATGTGVVVLNSAGDQITVSLNYSGLSSAASAGHIHGPAAIGADAGVLFDFSGSVSGTSGSVSGQTFAINSTHRGQLEAGLFYFNIHTGNFGGGEIRGQIGVTVPGAPTSVSGTRGNGQVSVAFGAPVSNGGSAITGYTVTATPGGATATGTSSPIVVTGLTNGTAYTFTVTATNIIGTGPVSSASPAVTPATVPSAPTSVVGTGSSGQVSVAFTVPTSNGGSAITGYTVTASPGGATGTGTSSPIVVTGLTNGTAYTFTVTATNGVGTSAASGASSAVTPGTVPGAPTNVVGTAGNGQVSVAFTAPSSSGGVAISGYTVTASPGGATGTGLSSPIVVSGLTNGTAYTFTVTATNAIGTGPASSASAAVTPSLPTLSRSPSTLSFGATNTGGTLSNITAAQTVTVTFVAASPTWTATTSTPWLQITGGSGTGNGTFSVSVTSAAGLPATGSTTGTITITSSGVSNSPVTIAVTLTLYSSTSSGNPFGFFETPATGASVAGSVAVGGWALDDIEVTKVELWRDRAAGETTPVYPGPGLGTGKIYIADMVFVNGARPDVEAANPTLPRASRAGWGYLLLTYGLHNQGNGTFTLHAFAYDRDGHSVSLGSTTITSSNTTATKPFGSIDTPAYGQTTSGILANFGWALTPNATPSCSVAGGSVRYAIDSGALQPVTYGSSRPDIASGFPGYTDSSAAGGLAGIDTTALSNGSHSIGWYVVDSCSRAEGVGSRLFDVLNSGTVPTDERGGATLEVMPSAEPIVVRRGVEQQVVLPDANADRVVPIAHGERIEIHLPANAAPYAGVAIVNGERRALPLGSSLDASAGIFYWEPAPAFLGAQDLEFEAGDEGPIRVRAIVGTSVQAVIDTPRAGEVESTFTIAGWAIDQAARTGTGIDAVHVWAYPAAGGEPIFLGVANYGDVRADVAATLGEQFGASSFSLVVNGTLAAGDYQIVVYPHSAVAGDFRAKVVRVVIR